jgi:hypothetical protein
MKKQIINVVIAIIAIILDINMGFATDANPLNPITFEPEGASYIWETWYTGSTFAVVDNPDVSGVNTSAKVGKFFMPSGSPNWVGTKTLSLKPIVITEENNYLSIDVYKQDLVGIQVSMESNDIAKPKAYINIKPTKVNEWLTFVLNFTALIGDTMEFIAIKPEDALTSNLTSDATFYFDNIIWSSKPVAVNILSSNRFCIFPNPANDFINICGVDEGTINISNINGEVVQQEYIRNDGHYNIAKLKEGIYFISVKSASGFRTVRFVKRSL